MVTRYDTIGQIVKQLTVSEILKECNSTQKCAILRTIDSNLTNAALDRLRKKMYDINEHVEG